MYAVSDALRRLMGRFRTRRAVVVLGNHRSGTSALTRAINLLGATLPGNLMPKTPDNTEGYWESRDVFKLNKALLDAAGINRHNDAPISPDWFASETVRAFREQAQALLQESFPAPRLFVI